MNNTGGNGEVVLVDTIKAHDMDSHVMYTQQSQPLQQQQQQQQQTQMASKAGMQSAHPYNTPHQEYFLRSLHAHGPATAVQPNANVTPLTVAAQDSPAVAPQIAGVGDQNNLVKDSEYFIEYSNGRKVIGVWDGKFFKLKQSGSGGAPPPESACAGSGMDPGTVQSVSSRPSAALVDQNNVHVSSHSATYDESKKRPDYLQWPDYFMAIAFLSAQRSKDPGSQVGACIVNDENKIVGIGYNGMPNGCSDDELPWKRKAENKLDTKYPYVCHAEMNAIMNKNSVDVKRCTMYVALFPCNECAKLVIQAGIREVVFVSDKYHHTPDMQASRRLLDMAGVTYRQFTPQNRQIVIDFDAIDKVPSCNTNTDSL